MEKLVFCSHNKNKITEIKEIFKNTGIEIITLEDIGCMDEIEETGTSYHENALIKAQYVYKRYGLPCFADDSGIEVEVLDNRPGICSARYADITTNINARWEKLLSEMEGKVNRRAKQVAAIVLVMSDTDYVTFTSIINGIITKEPRGDNFFHYDCIFQPTGYNRTFSEMSLKEKNLISHRAKALNNMIDFCKNK
jgi:XTP/dITP diphosphohydrolase